MAGGTDGYVFSGSFAGSADIDFRAAGDALGMGCFPTAAHTNTVLFDTLVCHGHKCFGGAVYFFTKIIYQSIDIHINPLSKQRLDYFDERIFRKKVNIIDDDFLDTLFTYPTSPRLRGASILQYLFRLVLLDVDDGERPLIMGTGVAHAAVALGFGFKYEDTEVEGGENREEREELGRLTGKHRARDDGKLALKRF